MFRFDFSNAICWRRGVNLLAGVALFVLAFGSGCNSMQEPSVKVVQGAVSYGEEPVEEGEVRFVPIDGTHGPLSVAAIDHGHYRVEARGGVPMGMHRVEVDAWTKTGRKVMKSGRFEEVAEEERARLGPSSYGDEQSPLRYELTPESDGRYDIKLPMN